MPRMGESGADVGGGASGDAHRLVEGRREDVVRVTARGPHLIEVAQVDVHDRAQGSGVADRGDAAC
jgi:hypothetical protein